MTALWANFENSYQPSREGNWAAGLHRAWAQSWLPDDANRGKGEQRNLETASVVVGQLSMPQIKTCERIRVRENNVPAPLCLSYILWNRMGRMDSHSLPCTLNSTAL